LSFGQLHQRNPEIQSLARHMNRTPSSVAMKLVNLASMDPQITANGRKGLAGASNLDRSVWAELQSHWDATATQAATAFARITGQTDMLGGDDANSDPLPDFAEGQTRAAIVQVRKNQHVFRRAVLSSYNNKCCISGLADERLLVASHIVPWSEDKENRLNPQNGLCLSALHDKAFDLGLITVTPEYRVLVSSSLHRRSADRFLADSLLKFDQHQIDLPERFKPKAEFLAWHGKRFGFT